MKIKRVLSVLVVAAFFAAAILSVMLTAACGGKTEDTEGSETNVPADSETQTAEPDQNTDPTLTPEAGEDTEATPDPDAETDPTSTEDPENPDATPDGNAGIIQNGGDIEIIIPTGQGSGGL